VDAGPAEPEPAHAELEPLTGDAAEAVLFVDQPGAAKAEDRANRCPQTATPRARTTCLVDLRYAAEPAAQTLAHELYERYGILAGLEAEHRETMGWRGAIHFVPELPVGGYRKHLEWISAAVHDIDELFRGLAGPVSPRYRFHPFVLRFMRSVGRTTPSAYAAPDAWEVAYNVSGSLNTSATAVRELLFHELFHRNDADAGTDGRHWSEAALAPVYRRIVARCHGRIECLTPYAPTMTRVRGGTYYAFQLADYDPVLEYAAELGLRWSREQRAVLRGEVLVAPFKCGPAENAEAWRLVVDEMFAGVDRVPACARGSLTAAFDRRADGGTLSP
jgi:hypothetical protein